MRTLTISLALLLLALPARARGRNARRELLVASWNSQAIQNARANAYHLSRMQNVAMIQRFHRDGYLVSVPASTQFYYLQAISPCYRYLRPWTKLFLDRLSQQYYARFRQRLRVTSLVRTVGSQSRLAHYNPNAAEARGPDRSAHLTGAALDISKRLMSDSGVRWMRSVLFQLKQSGYLYAIEEFEEPNFHIMVYPTYRQYAARLTKHAQDAQNAVQANATPGATMDTSER
jgi:Family of unknown function (DUF5715)